MVSPFFVPFPVSTAVELCVCETLIAFSTLDAVAIIADHPSLLATSKTATSIVITVAVGLPLGLAVVLPTILETFATAVSAIIALLLITGEIFHIGLPLDDGEIVEAVARETTVLTPHSQESLIDSVGNLGETCVELLIAIFNHILHHLGKSIDLRLHRFLLRLGIINKGSHLNSSFVRSFGWIISGINIDCLLVVPVRVGIKSSSIF